MGCFLLWNMSPAFIINYFIFYFQLLWGFGFWEQHELNQGLKTICPLFRSQTHYRGGHDL
jgi:hypothetical protein